jgi:single-stranded DNA-binding protein
MSSQYENRYRKGDLIAVTCKAQQNEWTDAEGNRRSSIDFVCKEISLLSRKNSDADKGDAPSSNPSNVRTDATGVGTYKDEDGVEQDLPF